MKIRKLYIPPTMMVYMVIIMLLFFLKLPRYNVIPFPFNFAGLLIALWGFNIMGKANTLFRKHKTSTRLGKSRALISEGIFSRSRNPMYLGMTILLSGLAIVSSNILSAVPVILFILHVRIVFIRREEIMLEESFGEEYKSYRKRVRRWI